MSDLEEQLCELADSFKESSTSTDLAWIGFTLGQSAIAIHEELQRIAQALEVKDTLAEACADAIRSALTDIGMRGLVAQVKSPDGEWHEVKSDQVSALGDLICFKLDSAFFTVRTDYPISIRHLVPGMDATRLMEGGDDGG